MTKATQNQTYYVKVNLLVNKNGFIVKETHEGFTNDVKINNGNYIIKGHQFAKDEKGLIVAKCSPQKETLSLVPVSSPLVKKTNKVSNYYSTMARKHVGYTVEKYNVEVKELLRRGYLPKDVDSLERYRSNLEFYMSALLHAERTNDTEFCNLNYKNIRQLNEAFFKEFLEEPVKVGKSIWGELRKSCLLDYKQLGV